MTHTWVASNLVGHHSYWAPGLGRYFVVSSLALEHVVKADNFDSRPGY
jgi:hypothetical protein